MMLQTASTAGSTVALIVAALRQVRSLNSLPRSEAPKVMLTLNRVVGFDADRPIRRVRRPLDPQAEIRSRHWQAV